jgi:nuclear pore complex protein Nup160
LELFVVAIVENGHSSKLGLLPFPSLQDEVDRVLLRRAGELIDISSSPTYHKILFSWRIRQGDCQGGTGQLLVTLILAASAMYQRLQLLRNMSSTDMDVDLETLEISEAYLAIINALSCVAEENAWIFVTKVKEIDEEMAAKRVKRDEQEKRIRTALSLKDVKKEYALELERQQLILGKVADELALDGIEF